MPRSPKGVVLESLARCVAVAVGRVFLGAAILRQDGKRADARAEAASLRGWTYAGAMVSLAELGIALAKESRSGGG